MVKDLYPYDNERSIFLTIVECKNYFKNNNNNNSYSNIIFDIPNNNIPIIIFWKCKK